MVLYMQSRRTQSSRSLGFDVFAIETLRRHLFCYSAIDLRAVLVVAVHAQSTCCSPGVHTIPVEILVFPSENVESDN